MVSQRNQPFYLIGPQMMFQCVSEHFVNIWNIKWCKTWVSGLNALFRVTKLVKMVSQRNQPFYLIGPQKMFRCVSKHFANLWNIKWSKTWVSGLNVLLRCTELAKMVSQWNQRSTSLAPNNVSECFGAFRKPLEHKMMQNLCFGPQCTISGYRTYENGFTTKSNILPHWTPNNVSECFGAFHKPLEHKMMENLSFRPQCTITGYRTYENGFATKSTILPH